MTPGFVWNMPSVNAKPKFTGATLFCSDVERISRARIIANSNSKSRNLSRSAMAFFRTLACAESVFGSYAAAEFIKQISVKLTHDFSPVVFVYIAQFTPRERISNAFPLILESFFSKLL